MCPALVDVTFALLASGPRKKLQFPWVQPGFARRSNIRQAVFAVKYLKHKIGSPYFVLLHLASHTICSDRL